MLLADDGSSADTEKSVGTANGSPSLVGLTGSVMKSVRFERLLRLVLGTIEVPKGWVPERSIVGRVVSIRKVSEVAVEKPGRTEMSFGAMATNLTLFRPSGRLAGAVIVNWPAALV